MKIVEMRFKSEMSLCYFVNDVEFTSANKPIGDALGMSPFTAVVNEDGNIVEIRDDKGISMFADYDPVFFCNEVIAYLTTVNEEKTVENLYHENVSLRARIAELENRIHRLERLV